MSDLTAKLNAFSPKLRMVFLTALSCGYGEGGTLVIGVDDQGNVLGLENDLSTLKGDDADAYELHLRNILNSEFGIEYAAANVKIRFHELLGEMICTVEVSKGAAPLFVQVTDKNGAKSEKFFVRSGNSSEPINNPSEISAYIAKRFKAA